MKSVFYLDNKGREILYVPLVFVVVNYSRNVPEIILEPKKLKLRLKRWKKGVVSLKKLIGLP